MKRAIFLDRDGVINQKAPEGEYVTRWEELHFLPGVADAIRLLNAAGFLVIIVSNQRCIAKGLLTIPDLESMHARMCEVLAAAGARIDGIYYCPHENEPPCGCRKPAPGMLLEAARDHEIDLMSSWMIGDSTADVEAGKKAGCRTAQVRNGDQKGHRDASLTAPSLLAAAEQILHEEHALRESRRTVMN